MEKFAYLDNRHDLSLPEWGPYSKTHFGISHLADVERGARFDFTVAPGVYRRQLGVPDALRPSGYLPWSVAADLEHYSYRQQLEAKDRVYADVSFSRIRNNVHWAECRCVNNTELPVPFGIHFLASLSLPPERSVVPLLPPGVAWIDALDHTGLTWATPRPQDNLAYDALRRGEVRESGCVNGGCIGRNWGLDAGDTLHFHLPSPGKIAIRCRATKELTLLVNNQPVTVPGTDEWVCVTAESTEELTIVSRGGTECRIDGVAHGEHAAATAFLPGSHASTPTVERGPVPHSRILTYEALEHCYGVFWDFDSDFVRRYRSRSMNHTLLYSDSIHQPFFGDASLWEPGEEWVDFVMQPIPVPPGGSAAVCAVICSGTRREVEEALRNAGQTKATLAFWEPESTPAGKEYLFSRERMASVTLSNVVFPTYCKRKNVRHHTPGRQWNCLYTWDSGFIGLGLLEIDEKRAYENLNAYLTEPDDDECAFIHHGSPVPVQFYLYAELLNRGASAELGRYFYPKLRHYYRFMAGHADSSTMRGKRRDTLIRSWDYFYNSGGWDDYPPQHYLHHHKLRDIAPAVGSSHVIRAARILRNAAVEFGFSEDIAMYDADIASLGNLLQEHSWDADAGIFSYVRHDENDKPAGILRHGSGVNFNFGFDGVSPLVSGICTPEQKEKLWEVLSNPARCRTPVGLSAVDQSAPYFRRDGYWNGSIWFPHQWFFWKAALDDNRSDFAWYIAETALKLCERETKTSYYCYENFSISGERGGGWHHFSALSCPVLNFFGAYFAPGRLTGGHGMTIRNRVGWSCDLEIGGEGESTLLAVVEAKKVTYNGEPCEIKERVPGCLEITLPRGTKGKLVIK